MDDRPSGLFRFVSELKRRHVFRATVAYAAVAFVVLQGAEIVVPAFGLSDAALRIVVVLAALGIPVVAVLAWVYEITPRGIRTMKELDAESGVRAPDAGDILPRVALLVVTLVAAGGGAWFWVSREAPVVPQEGSVTVASPATRAAAGEATIRSLAVLPLETFSAEPDRDYFAAGMHEAIVSRLSQVGFLRVISRTSTVTFDRSGKSMPEIGRELAVDGVVEGSVLLDGERVRITVQLIHAASDTHLWSRDYEREVGDVIDLQREVAAAIVSEIRGELEAGDEPARVAAEDAGAPADPEAAMADLMGRGMALGGGSAGELDAAHRHFEEALAEDSSYAPAMVGLAYTTMMREMETPGPPSPPGEALERARAWVDRALELAPDSREAAELDALLEDLPALLADAGAAGAVEVGEVEAPDVPGPGGAAWPWGGDEEAQGPPVTELGSRVLVRLTAMGAEKQGTLARLRASRSLSAVGRHQEAVEMLEGLVDDHPDLGPAWDELESLQVARGHLDRVVELRRRRVESGDSLPAGAPSVEALARAVEEEGARGYWEWRRRELEARAARGEPVRPLNLAACHAGLGNETEALDYLAEAARERDPRLLGIRHDPLWDAFRADPRFHRVLRRAFEPPAPAPGS